MKKLLPIFLFTFSIIFLNTSTVTAGSMEVSKSSSFSSSDLNFSAGETVYVRVSADSSATSYVLNIRDNNYSAVSTVGLNKNGGTFTTSFSAPGGEGYYSLESQIKGDGLNATSVKTIKIGSPSSANIKVSVNSNVGGSNNKVSNESKVSEVSKDEEDNQPIENNKEEVDRDEESDKNVYKIEEKQTVHVEVKKGLFASVFAMLDKLVSSFKLF